MLLIALWVRSYLLSEELFWKKANWNAVGVWSGAGRIVLSIHPRWEGGTHGLSYLGPWTDIDLHEVLEGMDRELPTFGGFGMGGHKMG